ncbi:mannitol dehydrogenase family protein [Agrococcus beijingensis]|uniref:mannitol dehydrogenase family protein n=1 Tax=Agrococcus beijingensis TaxID=3068634 RepID=UPI0027408D9B|nr:mannitol dehydrogenase family protein [Agrococcus sp. REN33]
MTDRISRQALADAGLAAEAAPVRIVHLGLGAFHRAHQAWYTANADDAADWGIAAFTGRSPAVADELRPQDGLFTLIVRDGDADRAEIVPSIVEAVSGDDVGRLTALLAAPETAIVTITITEPGYRLRADGSPDESDPLVAADVEALRDGGDPATTLGRLVAGLDARRAAGVGPLAVVPCDNMPDNGALVANGTAALAALAGLDETAAWIRDEVSFVSTSVDRITPRSTPADAATAERLTGFADASPVVTEPFRDWVLEGEFPAGRPAWETAGARFVDEIEPFERRKLWLLNGAHTLLAYTGLSGGHETVAAAVADPELRAAVDGLWDEAAAHLPEGLDLDAYRAALLDRFDNARIEHRLAQIGMEGVAKLRVRIAPVLLAERAAGRSGAASLRALTAWLALALDGSAPADAAAAQIDVARSAADPVAALLDLVDPRLAQDAEILASARAAAPTSG